MSTQAPPQWASASRQNGFSYLSWKRKILLAATVILCGSGLAAQFPCTTTSVEHATAAQTDFAGTIPPLSQSQNRYANNVQTIAETDGPSLAKSNEPFGKYVEPPLMEEENGEEKSSQAPQSLSSRKSMKFDLIDDSGLEKKSLNLPLARWNPRFEQPPPLSERLSQSQIDNSEIVPAQPETVIDSSHLVPAADDEMTIVLQADSIVPANHNPIPSETVSIISEDQIRPGNME